MKYPNWLAVEQTLAARAEGVLVLPSNSGRGGGAAVQRAFGSTVALPLASAAPELSGRRRRRRRPNAFEPVLSRTSTRTPRTLPPQMQQQVPPGYQQMHPQQPPFIPLNPSASTPRSAASRTRRRRLRNPVVSRARAPGHTRRRRGVAAPHEPEEQAQDETNRATHRLQPRTRSSETSRFVQEDQNTHFKVFKFPNDGSAEPAYRVRKNLDPYELDDAGDETSSREDEGSGQRVRGRVRV